jgi:hypothetical protein
MVVEVDAAVMAVWLAVAGSRRVRVLIVEGRGADER